MRIRRYSLAVACALLGAAVPVLPAAAGSEANPTVEAVRSGIYYSWSPTGVTIPPGASVNLSNPSSTVPHGVRWIGSTPTPACEKVPVNSSATEWHGTCTFATAGTYTFYCTVHGSEMTGRITVGTATATPTTTTTTYTQPTAPGTIPPPPPTTSTASGPLPAAPGEEGSPLTGEASQAIRLPASQRGSAVHGSLAVSTAGAGGRLQVDLLARRATLARAGARVRVGRLVRFPLSAGRVSFSVALDAQGRAALRRHRRLALEVRLLLTPSHRASVTVSRTVVLHA